MFQTTKKLYAFLCASLAAVAVSVLFINSRPLHVSLLPVFMLLVALLYAIPRTIKISHHRANDV